MLEILTANIPITIAVLGLAIYFLVVSVMFIISPVKNAAMFAMKPDGPAGVTEIRVYYGGISFALGFFLLFLFSRGLGEYALIGGLIFANIVFFTRFVFTFADGGWKEKYTKLAIPVEALFVVALWTMFILSRVL
ncbi:MAG: hypothetical protein LBN05_08260 [Oscillospiraceae bacterium]|jgi:hypothetical protein|nr:hypothetical protein [Oscillospiraceae bacterium]